VEGRVRHPGHRQSDLRAGGRAGYRPEEGGPVRDGRAARLLLGDRSARRLHRVRHRMGGAARLLRRAGTSVQTPLARVTEALLGASARLRPTSDATTVQVRDGRALISGGRGRRQVPASRRGCLDTQVRPPLLAIDQAGSRRSAPWSPRTGVPRGQEGRVVSNKGCDRHTAASWRG